MIKPNGSTFSGVANNPPPAPPAPPPPSATAKVFAKASQISGFTSVMSTLGAAWHAPRYAEWIAAANAFDKAQGVAQAATTFTAHQALYQAKLWVGRILNSPVFAAFTVVMGGYSIFTGVRSLRENFTVGGLAGVSMGAMGFVSGAGMLAAKLGITIGASAATSSSGMIAGMIAGLTNPVGWIALGVMLMITLLWPHADPTEVAGQQMNTALRTIYTTGTLAFVGVGTIALTAGFRQNAIAPTFAQISIPTYQIRNALRSSNVPNPNGRGSFTLVDAETGQLMVIPSIDDDDQNTQAQFFSLRDEFSIVSTNAPKEGYIPLYIYRNGVLQPNPEAIQSYQTQDSLLNAVLSGRLSGHDALNAVTLASTANKYSTSPVSNSF